MQKMFRFMTSQIIETIGDYSLEETDHFYREYSGYKYIVTWSKMFSQDQLKGFREGQLEEAKTYLRSVAEKDTRGKKYDRTKNSMQKRLKAGQVCVPHEDKLLLRQYKEKGYVEVCTTKTYIWLAKRGLDS